MPSRINGLQESSAVLDRVGRVRTFALEATGRAVTVASRDHATPVAGRTSDHRWGVVGAELPWIAARRCQLEADGSGCAEALEHEGVRQCPKPEEGDVAQSARVDV